MHWHQEIKSKFQSRDCAHAHLWRFSGHLDASLQYRDGEPRVGGGTEPESEVRVGGLIL